VLLDPDLRLGAGKLESQDEEGEVVEPLAGQGKRTRLQTAREGEEKADPGQPTGQARPMVSRGLGPQRGPGPIARQDPKRYLFVVVAMRVFLFVIHLQPELFSDWLDAPSLPGEVEFDSEL
jgi:hypothetical protein